MESTHLDNPRLRRSSVISRRLDLLEEWAEGVQKVLEKLNTKSDTLSPSYGLNESGPGLCAYHIGRLVKASILLESEQPVSVGYSRCILCISIGLFPMEAGAQPSLSR